MPRAFLAVLALLLAGCATPALPDADAGPAFVASAARVLEGLGGYASEPHLAAREGPGAAVLVVASAEYVPGDSVTKDRRFRILVHRSVDDGASWTVSPLPAEVRAPFDPAGALDYVGDPVLAFAPDGTLYLAAVAAHGVWKDSDGRGVYRQLSSLTAFVTRSEDDGATWSPAVFHHRGVGALGSALGASLLVAGTLEDKPWLGVSPDGVVHLTWTEFVEAQTLIRHVRSSDGGATWTAPGLVGAARPGTLLQGSTVVAPGGHALVVSATERDLGPPFRGRQLAWTSADAGVTFAGPAEAAPAAGPWYGSLVADPTDPSRVALLVVDGPEPARVLLAASTDGGATWGEAVPLAGGRSGDQSHPAGRFAPDGSLHLGWYDAGWEDGERFTFAVHAAGALAFEGAPPGAPIAPGPYKREYLGLAGAGEATWAAWIGGDAGSGTWVEVARLARSGNAR